MPRRKRALAGSATVLFLLLLLGIVDPPGVLGHEGRHFSGDLRDEEEDRRFENELAVEVDLPNADGKDRLPLEHSPPAPADISDEDSDDLKGVELALEDEADAQWRGLRHHWSSSSSYKRKKKYKYWSSSSKSKKKKYKRWSSSSSSKKKKKKHYKKTIFKKFWSSSSSSKKKKVKKYYYRKKSSSSSKKKKYYKKYKKSSSSSWWW